MARSVMVFCECGEGMWNRKGKKGRYWWCAECDRTKSIYATESWSPARDWRTRRARSRLHSVFDPVWRQTPRKGRRRRRGILYGWLARQLAIPLNRCHIGAMDYNRCMESIEIIRDLRPRFKGNKVREPGSTSGAGEIV